MLGARVQYIEPGEGPDREAGLRLLSAEGLDLVIGVGFIFTDDLTLLDPRGIRAVLEAVPSDRLTLALKTASEELKAHIFRGMSKRAAERVREDLEMLGAVRLADVEAAQQEVIEQCLRLAAEGVISLEGSDALV